MNQDAFEIIGGQPLKGIITPQGAKNEALEVIAAVLLTEEKVTISNVPKIKDVLKLIEILKSFGVKVEQTKEDTYVFQADDINIDYFETDEFRLKTGKLRGSVMTLGPLLARFKKAYLPQPGGDKIGRRRLDAHFLGLEALGATFKYDTENSTFTVKTDGLKGTYLLMDEPSVTGTANIIMAASMAEGETTIYHAACEPYTQQLCRMLNSMGADISGIGSNMIKIRGVEKLGGCEHRILPDMLEIGSFIGLAAITQSDILIKDTAPEYLGMIPRVFQRLGIQLDVRENGDIHIPAQDKYKIKTFIDGSILTISDHPWPGFTPDLLSIALVVATQAEGSVLVHQKMFESRLFFTDRLIEMGAQIMLCDPHRAVVIGLNRQTPLRGIRMSSPDIRAGIALLIAALSAKGKSVISNIHQIDRGYQNIDTRLQALGANIKRL